MNKQADVNKQDVINKRDDGRRLSSLRREFAYGCP